MAQFKLKTSTGKKYTFKGSVADKLKKALKPGKRKSSSGRIYYEYRPNHADYNPKKRY
jgi:hypothetical protein